MNTEINPTTCDISFILPPTPFIVTSPKSFVQRAEARQSAATPRNVEKSVPRETRGKWSRVVRLQVVRSSFGPTEIQTRGKGPSGGGRRTGSGPRSQRIPDPTRRQREKAKERGEGESEREQEWRESMGISTKRVTIKGAGGCESSLD